MFFSCLCSAHTILGSIVMPLSLEDFGGKFPIGLFLDSLKHNASLVLMCYVLVFVCFFDKKITCELYNLRKRTKLELKKDPIKFKSSSYEFDRLNSFPNLLGSHNTISSIRIDNNLSSIQTLASWKFPQKFAKKNVSP